MPEPSAEAEQRAQHHTAGSRKRRDLNAGASFPKGRWQLESLRPRYLSHPRAPFPPTLFLDSHTEDDAFSDHFSKGIHSKYTLRGPGSLIRFLLDGPIASFTGSSSSLCLKLN